MQYVCAGCGKEFAPSYPRSSRRPAPRFCGTACATERFRKLRAERIGRYDYAYRPDHPLTSDGSRVVAVHRMRLFALIGPGAHRCHWCRSAVTWSPNRSTKAGALIADHRDGDSSNNDSGNLVPSCHRCNCTRNQPNAVRDDEPFIHMTGNRGRHRAVPRQCPCGNAFLALAADKRPNRGRYCSRSCARQRL